MMTGSSPIEARDLIRARGARPSLLEAFSFPRSTAAEPSTMLLLLPAGVYVVDVLNFGIAADRQVHRVQIGCPSSEMRA